MLSARRTAGLLIAFALACLLLPGAYVYVHLGRGSDGAHVLNSAPAFSSAGAHIAPYEDANPDIPSGAIVTAVQGRDMGYWAGALLRGDVERPSWQPGDTVSYRLETPDAGEMQLHITLTAPPIGNILRDYWGVFAFTAFTQIIGALVLWRRPADPAAQTLFLLAFSGSHAYAWSFPLEVGDLIGGLGFWLFQITTSLLWVIYFAAGMHLSLVFPRPQRYIQRNPRAPLLIYLGAMTLFLTVVGLGGVTSSDSLAWLPWWSTAGDLVSALCLAATLIIMILRYRRMLSPEDRREVRWAVYGACLSGALGLFMWILAPRILGTSILTANTLGLLMMPFPASLAIAIWRHRLFDIDLIIHRTLIYGILSTLLVGIYLTLVILTQAALGSQVSGGSPLSVVLSTLATAGLFSPLRSRVHRFIDRRFYRQKYDARRALSRFARSARQQLDFDQLIGELHRIAFETMQPDRMTIWLKEDRAADASWPRAHGLDRPPGHASLEGRPHESDHLQGEITGPGSRNAYRNAPHTGES